MTTPADRGAIDLEAHKQYCQNVEDHSQSPFITLKIREVRALIAEVETLREREMELAGALEMAAEHCAMLVRPTNEEEALAENIRTALATTPAEAPGNKEQI